MWHIFDLNSFRHIFDVFSLTFVNANELESIHCCLRSICSTRFGLFSFVPPIDYNSKQFRFHPFCVLNEYAVDKRKALNVKSSLTHTHTYSEYYTRVFARAKIKCERKKNSIDSENRSMFKALNEQKMQYHRWNKRRLYRLCSHPSQFHECSAELVKSTLHNRWWLNQSNAKQQLVPKRM